LEGRGSGNYLKQTSVATLVVGAVGPGGLLRALKTYETLEKHDKDQKNFVVLVPGTTVAGMAGPESGRDYFGSSTGIYFRSQFRRRGCLLSKGQGKRSEAKP